MIFEKHGKECLGLAYDFAKILEKFSEKLQKMMKKLYFFYCSSGLILMEPECNTEQQK